MVKLRRLSLEVMTFVFIVLLLPAVSMAVELDADNNQAIDLEKGGTNAKTAEAARASLGLGSEDTVVFGGIDVIPNPVANGEWGQWVFKSDTGSHWMLFHPKSDMAENYTVNIPLIDGDVAIVVAPPSAATDPCKPGSLSLTAGYFYYCVQSGQWQRAPMASW